MKHKMGFNHLNRTAPHRRAMLRNMATSLFRYERIRTTKSKALELRKVAEKMITRARVDSVHNRRIIGRDIQDEGVLVKLFKDVAPRFMERPGGYTRILKLGQRPGDAAEMVLIELVERKKRERKQKQKPKKEAEASA